MAAAPYIGVPFGQSSPYHMAPGSHYAPYIGVPFGNHGGGLSSSLNPVGKGKATLHFQIIPIRC